MNDLQEKEIITTRIIKIKGFTKIISGGNTESKNIISNNVSFK